MEKLMCFFFFFLGPSSIFHPLSLVRERDFLLSHLIPPSLLSCLILAERRHTWMDDWGYWTLFISGVLLQWDMHVHTYAAVNTRCAQNSSTAVETSSDVYILLSLFFSVAVVQATGRVWFWPPPPPRCLAHTPLCPFQDTSVRTVKHHTWTNGYL